eukprot:68058-Alexandrium_andersonii.AAC.1
MMSEGVGEPLPKRARLQTRKLHGRDEFADSHEGFTPNPSRCTRYTHPKCLPTLQARSALHQVTACFQCGTFVLDRASILKASIE